MKLLLILWLCTLCQSTFAPTGHIWGTRLGEFGPRYGWPVLPPAPPVQPPIRPYQPPAIPEWQLRIVDGQLYNIVHSVKWERLIPRVVFVRKILPDGVIFAVHEQSFHQVVSEGQSTTRWSPWQRTTEYNSSRISQTISLPAGSCFVRNFPDAQLLTEGERITPDLLVIRVLPFKFGEETLPAYDCGLDNTPENRLTLKPAPVKATNAVAIK